MTNVRRTHPNIRSQISSKTTSHVNSLSWQTFYQSILFELLYTRTWWFSWRRTWWWLSRPRISWCWTRRRIWGATTPRGFLRWARNDGPSSPWSSRPSLWSTFSSLLFALTMLWSLWSSCSSTGRRNTRPSGRLPWTSSNSHNWGSLHCQFFSRTHRYCCTSTKQSTSDKPNLFEHILIRREIVVSKKNIE